MGVFDMTKSANKPKMIISSEGAQLWKLDGLLHREDGPAVIWPDGGQEWWLNGNLHREDGPAVIEPDGTQEWWANSIKYSNIDEWATAIGIDPETVLVLKLQYG